MSCEFQHVREVAVGALPDAAPNTTPPTDQNLLPLSGSPLGVKNAAPMNAVTFCFDSDNHAAGTVDWALWARDARTKRFVGPFATGAATAQDAPVTKSVPVGAEVFVQITAKAGFAASTKIITRATEAIL